MSASIRRRTGSRRMTWPALAVATLLGVGVITYTALSPAAPAPTGRDTAASFTARTLDGEIVAVPGSRPSVLLFFSVECGGCGPTARTLAQTKNAARDKAAFVAVDIAGYETDHDVRAFLTANQATTLAYAIDTDTSWMRAYRVNQLSTVVVLDASGEETFRAIEPTAEQLAAELAEVTRS